MNTINTDWTSHNFVLQVGNREYSVKCFVMLTLKETMDEYSRTGRDEQVADWNLEAWDSLPPCPSEHEKEIERQILELLQEEYGPIL